eukprot:gene28012-34804_t
MPDDEILLDYGDAYNAAYLLPKPPVTHLGETEVLSTSELIGALPFCDEDSDGETTAQNDEKLSE